MERIDYIEFPKLRRPYLIVGFEGWPNAAEVSSTAVQYLVEQLQGKRFASIPVESFYQFSSLRPAAVIKAGRLLELNGPKNDFFFARGNEEQDLILFSGVEPHLRWEAFTNLLLDLAEKQEVCQIITLGGTYDYIPHTVPPVVSALFNREDLRESLIRSELRLTDYSGPISIHTFLMEGARKRGLPGISLWGHAPQYLQAKNVKVVRALLHRLTALTGLTVDLSQLERMGEYFDQQVNHLIEKDPKLQEVIMKLEGVYRQASGVSSAGAKEEESKEDKVVYIQAFLKRQDEEGEPEKR